MATCTDIDAALARLEAKIDAIPKIDEQSIIQKASSDAQSKLNPKISKVGFVAAGAVITATQAQSAASIARELADDALKLGGQALSKIGALAGSVAELFGKFSGLLGIVLNLLTTIAIVYILGSRIDSLEKDIGVLRQIIEADAALTRKAINASNEAIAKANAAIAKADLAIGTANAATLKANFAVEKANKASLEANEAVKIANGTNIKVASLASKVATVEEEVKRVTGELPAMKAETRRAHRRLDDFEKGVEALYKDFILRLRIVFERLIDAINALGIEVNGRVDILSDAVYRIDKLLEAVKSSIGVLVGRIVSTEKTAISAFGLANQANTTASNANSTANQARREANELRPPIYAANTKADQAQTTANQVSAQVPPLRLLSERAYADALKAYNTVKTDVPPLVSGIEQVRRAGATIEQQFKAAANNVQGQFKTINSTIQSRLAQPAQTINNQQQIINQQFQTLAPAINNRITNLEKTIIPTITNKIATAIDPATNNRLTALEKAAVNPADSATLKRIEAQIANFPKTIGAPTTEQIKQAINPGLLAIPAAVGAVIVPKLLNPTQVTSATRNAICQEAAPNACLGKPLNNLQNGQNQQNNLLQGLSAGLQAVQSALLTAMNNTLNSVSRGVAAVNATALTINTKMGAQMAGGLAGGVGRLGTFLGIDRIFNLLTFLVALHNASMLTANLKTTLLETLSTVGKATGLLKTPEGENVELNKVFDQGIEAFIVKIVGVEIYAEMKLAWRKYNPIFRAGSNVLSNVGNMFSSIGNGIEVIGERSGKIGNALRAAGVVRENAYNYMSENMTVHTNKFMTFQTKIGGATEFVEAINEVAESVIEGQEGYTEAVKATDAFKKTLAEADKDSEKKDAQNLAIKAEAEKIKANLVKDPTGEDETGLLSFLTDL